MSLALDGIKILDFTRHIAGPTCTQILGDLGADVIKVESAPSGDSSREVGPFDDGQSVFFLSANRNKRSLLLDLKQNGTRDILVRLAQGVDIIIDNFRAGVLKSMGLDYELLKEANPGLIYCSITGYGSTGPGSTLPGFDQIAQGISGLMSITGSPETGPVRSGLPIGDITAGMWATIGILGALVHRNSTGQGQRVQTSLLEALVSVMYYQGQRYLSRGEVIKGQGNDHPLNFPHGTFKTKDLPINIASSGPKMWKKLCQVLKMEEFAEDPRFSDNALRMQNREELRAIIEEHLAVKPSIEWITIINEAGIPAGPILDLEEVFNHPQVQHLGIVRETVHPKSGEPLKVTGIGVKLSESSAAVRLRPPLLGENSFDILREAGYSEAEIETFLSSGIVQEKTSSVL